MTPSLTVHQPDPNTWFGLVRLVWSWLVSTFGLLAPPSGPLVTTVVSQFRPVSTFRFDCYKLLPVEVSRESVEVGRVSRSH